MQKQCTKCGLSKGVSRFSRVAAGSEKRKNVCKDCCNESARARRVPKREPLAPVAPGNKRCTKCREEKPLGAFCSSKNRKDGIYPQCRACQAEYRSNPEARARHLEVHRNWRNANRERRRATDRRLRYGVDDEFLKAMFKEQGEQCANPSCDSPLGFGETHVDHDRSCCPGRTSCGKCVRGLLCPGCNVGLGYFKDDPERLRGIALYVERTRR